MVLQAWGSTPDLWKVCGVACGLNGSVPYLRMRIVFVCALADYVRCLWLKNIILPLLISQFRTLRFEGVTRFLHIYYFWFEQNKVSFKS